MKTYVLVDGNSIGQAAHHGTKRTANGMEVQAVLGFLNSLVEMKRKYASAIFLVLWDCRAQWRFDLYPLYKGNREATPEKKESREAYSLQKPYIRKALELLGVAQMDADNYEADDLAGWLTEKYTKEGHNVVLITGDEDWLQLMRPGVTWRDWRDYTRVVTEKNFKAFTGFENIGQFLESKVLNGDTSDYIQGVGGFGPIAISELIAEFGSVRNYFRKCDEGFVHKRKAFRRLYSGTITMEDWLKTYEGDPDDEKAVKKHMAAWPGDSRLRYLRNLRLMQLLKVAAPDPKSTRLVRGKLDKERFADFCADLNFISILRRIDGFCSVFE